MIKKKGWEKFFAPQILSRGFEYYKTGLVLNAEFVEADNLLCANICGTEEYNVSVYFNDNREEIVEMYCDCPYAEDGKNCKHMAALLYAFDDGLKLKTEKICFENTYVPIKSIIDSLSEEEAKEYLLEAALKNKSLSYNLFLIKSSTDVIKEQIKYWKYEVKNIIYNAVGIYDYIEYEEAFEMFQELIEYLDMRMDTLLKKELFDYAFELICCSYEELDSCEFDDLDGGYSDFLSFYYDSLKRILDSADIVLKRKIYKWLLENDEGYYLLENFEEKEFLLSNLNLIESDIEACSDHNEFILSDLINKKCSIMRKLNMSESEISEFRNRYRYLYYIRKNEADEYFSNHDFEKAENLAIEGKSIDTDNRYISAWSENLINIYKSTNQNEKHKEELLYYIFELHHFELDRIKDLKKLVSEDEWLCIRNQLIESDIFFDRCEFLCSEKLYKELLENIVKNNISRLFVIYEKELVENLPIEARDAFLAVLDKEMQRANKRSWYESIVSKLSRIRKKYPDGKVYADNLAQKWAVQYKRRSAMLEELRYVGFDV